MIRGALTACLLAALAVPGVAQDRAQDGVQQRAARGQGGVLRGLDRITGKVRDLDLDSGQTVTFGSLRVRLDECRYPADNPDGDAYAFVTVHEDRDDGDTRIFSGWMLASSPALNPLEHHRYDVWVLRCKT